MKNLFNRSILCAAVVAMCVACNTNEPEASVQTCAIDDIEFSYYLTDTANVVKSIFSEGEIVRVHLDMQNIGKDTIMVFVNDIGDCFDTKGHLQESLSIDAYNGDTVPVFRSIYPNSTTFVKQSYVLLVSPGLYHYQTPYVMFYVRNEESEECIEIKHKSLPLTINFKVK